jgi:endonuclease-3
MNKERIKIILSALRKHYPKGEKPWAGGSDPFHTVIGTIMSAQTTDAQVDSVTPILFKKYPTPARLAKAKLTDVKRIIAPVGLHHAKAKNIIATSKMISNDFKGKVPDTRDELMSLPGVGRKTANVVLIKAFGKAAMPVDTHVFRVANRIGLATAKTPSRIEEQLEKIIPRRNLGAAHFWMIYHGRTLCTARNPKCNECPIQKYCDYVAGDGSSS